MDGEDAHVQLQGANRDDDRETSEPDGIEAKQEDRRWKRYARRLWSEVFPQLTLHKGREQLSQKKSVLIVSLFYSSHFLSAWGDRMWGFAVSLFVAFLYPDSLLLPGIYGFTQALCVVLFGTMVGDLVDTNPRLRVVFVSLVSQNGMVALCSAIISLMFYYQWTVCNEVVLFGCLMVVIMLLGSAGNLATTANTISIEKDWVAVIADGQPDTLAVFNGMLRRIDLFCKLVSPATIGFVLEYGGINGSSLPFYATVYVAIWNILSFFVEYVLIWCVYKLLPTLAVKTYRRRASERLEFIGEEEKGGGGGGNGNGAERADRVDDEENENNDDQGTTVLHYEMAHHTRRQRKQQALRWARRACVKLLSPYYTIKNGWRTYIKQDIARVGFAMAALYLTVLGFSGVTSTYFLTQGLTNDLIGVFYGLGGVVGILGTLVYPHLRRRIGTVRTGLFGLCSQVTMLLVSGVGVFIPSANDQGSTSSAGYYSANCSQEVGNDTINGNASNYSFSGEFGGGEGGGGGGGIGVGVILVVVGVIGARFGLWMFDLSVSQLVQERVVEEERGVVSGVMSSMNSNMDMLHYILVIIAPRPQDFRYLALVSVVMVTSGLLMYASYVHKVRGHLFHFSKLCRCFGVKGGSARNRRHKHSTRGGGGAASDDTTTLVNPYMEEEGEEEEEEGGGGEGERGEEPEVGGAEAGQDMDGVASGDGVNLPV